MNSYARNTSAVVTCHYIYIYTHVTLSPGHLTFKLMFDHRGKDHSKCSNQKPVTLDQGNSSWDRYIRMPFLAHLQYP